MTESEFRGVLDSIGIAAKLPTGQAWNLYQYYDRFEDVEDPLREVLMGVDRED